MNKKGNNTATAHPSLKPSPKPTTLSVVPKQVPKLISKRSRRKSPNDDVSNERRQQLLELILKTNSIRRAANELKINNSTAKSIFYKYKQTGQIRKNPRVRTKDGDAAQSDDGDCPMVGEPDRLEDDKQQATYLDYKKLRQQMGTGNTADYQPLLQQQPDQ